MKTLVTGATGFIGSNVVKLLLKEGREVRAYMQPGQPRDNLKGLDVEIVEGDLTAPRQADGIFKDVDIIHHLAAIYDIWLPRRNLMYEVNVQGTVNFLREAMRKAPLKKVVFTSSIAGVGTNRDRTPADENTLFNNWTNSNDYVLSKYLSELEVQRMVLQEGLPATIVNPGFPFGWGDIAPTPTGKTILQVLNGQVPGFWKGGFSVVDVENVALGHILAEKKGKDGERHILTAHNMTYHEFGQAVGRLAGVKVPSRVLNPKVVRKAAIAMEWAADHITHKRPLFTPLALDYSAQYLYFDNRKAREVLAMPVTPLDEVIRKSIRWFLDRGLVTKKLKLKE